MYSQIFLVTSVRGIAQNSVDSGIEVNPSVLYWFIRLSGQSRLLRAGSYEVKNGESAWDLIQKLSRGEESLQALVLVEGWTFRQFRAALDRSEHLQHLTRGQADEAIMAQLGRSGQAAEGRFFPDTYTHGKGDSDLRIMRRAMKAMDRQLANAWQARASFDIGQHRGKRDWQSQRPAHDCQCVSQPIAGGHAPANRSHGDLWHGRGL